MSIQKMISEHPAVGDDYNDSLGLAVKHALYCAAICNSCADACVAEEGDMARCIRLCSDCSDICTATYRVASRRTDENRAIIRDMLALCIKACETCAEQCESHDDAHCRRCAEMCRECARDCKAALDDLRKEAA
ncbi:four-helix bundle copper-binding protein [Croceicoccus sp. YJ47]|uniref:four-helix bundle copper-binding protein n=1 Tax=Croceicoccus sp. YJ47 TaxID=2798724 RepID=UPI00192199CC|nr:four-helix bundle copper-binding protein [Croceicoccus sp. YJ47]QQN74863.1 four-helix bundle copper-binding protein [Croceicoccus sp. YJ47]